MALGTPTDGGAAYSAAGGGGTSVTPAYPASIAANDVLVLIVGQKPSTANSGSVTTPSGWTLRESITGQGGFTTTLGNDTGNTNLFFYTKDTVDGTETGNLTVTVATNNVCWGLIIRIPGGGGTSFSYGTADGARATAPTSGTPYTNLLTNGATAPNLQAGDIAIWAMCIPTDVLNNGYTAPTISSTGTTFATPVELEEPDSSNGFDIGGYVAYAVATSGSSTAAPTVGVTATGTVTNARGPIVLIRVRDTSRTLEPAQYDNTQTFFAATVTAGTVTLTPALYTNDQTFYAADVTQAGGAQNLDPSLYTNDQTFYAPTVASTYALTPGLYTNTQTFYAPAVTTVKALTPDLYTNPQTFYTPAVTQSGVPQTLTPNLYTNNQTFYTPVVTTTYVLSPGLYTNTQTFYAPTVSQSAAVQTLAPDLYTNTQTFYAPAVTTNYTLAPQGYVDDGYVDTGYAGPNTFSTQVFYAPTVTSVKALQPPLLTNTQTFFPATVENSLYTITRAQALKLLQIHLLHGLGVSPLVVGPTSRVSGAVQQSVAESGGTVFIGTTSAPSTFTGVPGTLIEELAALHGLGETLSVTATSRTAGAISQTIATTGGVTTVTRV